MQEHCSLLCLTGPVGKRQDTRGRIEAQIIESGRQQLSAEGAAGLSLRAIARDLGMVSSAVYRYVASRDDLLTLLLVDAYSELADAVDAARAGAGEGWRDQITAIAHAAPRLGRRPPGQLGVALRQSGTRLSRATGVHRRPGHPRRRRIVRRGGRGNRCRGPRHHGHRSAPDYFRRTSTGCATSSISQATMPRSRSCFALWAGLVGAISLEVFGQYGADTLSDPASIFDVQVRLWLHMLAG